MINRDPWKFLRDDLSARLDDGYEVQHVGDRETYATTKDPKHRPIMRVLEKRTGSIINILAINQKKNDYDAGDNVKRIVQDYARQGQHSVVLPLDGPNNRLEALESSSQYNGGDQDFHKDFSHLSKSELHSIYLVNGIEFSNIIPVGDRHLLQRVGADSGMDHYLARKVIDKEGYERGDVLSLEQITMAQEGWPLLTRRIRGPRMVGLMIDYEDPSRPGLMVPGDKQKWSDYLAGELARTYHKGT